jgi:DNA-binding transcriptional MerR regulator
MLTMFVAVSLHNQGNIYAKSLRDVYPHGRILRRGDAPDDRRSSVTMTASNRPTYSIGAVARMLDTPPATLRAWEERYGVVVPHRGNGTHRLYTREQVEQLRYIKGQIEAGMSAADAHRLLEDEIGEGRPPTGGSAAGPPKPLVLIAERDPYAAELAEYFLNTEGYDVCVALDASRASALFNERSPDVVVIDLLISGGAGFRLCREFTRAAEVRLLAVSALESAEEAMSAGASAFLGKPLEPLDLVSIVRDLLGTSALARTGRGTQPA